MQINVGSLRFELKPFYTISYIILTVILTGLGSWQLSRSEEKRQFLELETARLHSDKTSLSELLSLTIEQLQYRQVELKGYYDQTQQFLLDNRIHNGKPGFFVLTPFIVDGNSAILVNRGWLPAELTRTKLPDVTIKQVEQVISGRINRFPSVGIKIKEGEIPSGHWPSIIQWVDAKSLADTLNYQLMPFQLELDADQPDGYLREWKIATPISPEQHIAYALQWFGLALTLSILFIFHSIKKG